jgi:SAM-dependent methyltransferase
MTAMNQPLAGYAAVFDGLSSSYDQSGVPFFTLIARGLVDRLAPQPGEHVLEVGAGRGAATFPLAAAVGGTGRVDAFDIAPGMVRHLAEDTEALPQVHVALGDGADPRPPGASYDVVASSLVLFFLADPVAGLKRWRSLLRPAGRLGIATFQPWRDAWRRLDELVEEFAGYPEDPDAAEGGVFDSDAGVEALLTSAGFGSARSETETFPIVFDDIHQWRRWSFGTTMGGLWRQTPESTHPDILRRAKAILEEHRDEAGRLVLEVDARYTFGVNPGAR